MRGLTRLAPAGGGCGGASTTAKDQSYVLSMLTQDELCDLLLPVGDMTKSEVRSRASSLGLRTAAKPDSQDVCFIHSASGRSSFLADRMSLHPGVVVDRDGRRVGEVPAVELVTIGQRKGLGVGGSADAQLRGRGGRRRAGASWWTAPTESRRTVSR